MTARLAGIAAFPASLGVAPPDRRGAPTPMDSNILALDRKGEQLPPVATIIGETTPERQTALIKHIVERVTVTDGEATGIALRPEARPFYAGLVMAPPDGSRGARPTFVIEGVDVLVMELLAA